jgi:hypothetical protein
LKSSDSEIAIDVLRNPDGATQPLVSFCFPPTWFIE